MAGKNPFDPFDDDYSSVSKPDSSRNEFSSSNTNNYGSSRPYGKDSNYEPPPPSKYELLQQMKQQSMNRQLDSTQRCLASIYDSESIGVATAEELVRQGEQLDNVEKNVDKIVADTKISQRHLNSIKSVFGGIKNWWNGEGKKEDTTSSSSGRDRSTSLLQQTLTKERETGVHPAMRLRSGDVRGFYDDDVADFKDFDPNNFGSNNTSSAGRVSANNSLKSNPDTQRQQIQATSARSTEWQEYEKGLEKNLDLMSNGLSNLKVLAQGLGEEIVVQNDQLDRITDKVDRADTKVRNQNLQMRHILGK